MLKVVGACYVGSLRHSLVGCSRSWRPLGKVMVQYRSVTSRVRKANVHKYGFIAFGGVIALRKLALARAVCDASQTFEETPHSQHDSPWLISSQTVYETDLRRKSRNRFAVVRFIVYLWRTVMLSIKIMLRICTLFIYFAPLVVSYPLLYWSDEARMRWWRIAIWAMQSSGPTLIKLGQWASTRRDLFSKEFCDKLSVLHTKVSDISWHCSSSHLDNLFGGRQWKSFIISVDPKPVGSGCIAQVYRALLDVEEFQKSTGIQVDRPTGRQYKEIAIKVAKPGIRERIEIDLAILKSITRIAQAIIPNLFFVNPLSSLRQFEIVLQRQVDLKNEAKALKRFSSNFDVKQSAVRFPQVYCYSKDVIIESFEGGMPVNKLVTGDTKDLAHQSVAVRRRVALLGARAILKMIFVDNFVHGDLHPGNILVRFNENGNGNGDKEVHRSPFSGNVLARAMEYLKTKLSWTHEPRIRFTQNIEYEDEPTLVILDTGIAIEETPNNLRNLRSLFAAIIEKRGYDAGALLLKHAPEHNCSDPEEFCREVEDIVRIARSVTSLRKLDISQLLNELFSIVSRHQVALETSFTTVILAVMVLEGLGRSLDPDLDLFKSNRSPCSVSDVCRCCTCSCSFAHPCCL